MLTTLNTSTFLTEAMSVASLSPCWPDFAENRQHGYVRALAWRHAR
jgi:hypothetical protein